MQCFAVAAAAKLRPPFVCVLRGPKAQRSGCTARTPAASTHEAPPLGRPLSAGPNDRPNWPNWPDWLETGPLSNTPTGSNCPHEPGRWTRPRSGPPLAVGAQWSLLRPRGGPVDEGGGVFVWLLGAKKEPENGSPAAGGSRFRLLLETFFERLGGQLKRVLVASETVLGRGGAARVARPLAAEGPQGWACVLLRARRLVSRPSYPQCAPAGAGRSGPGGPQTSCGRAR